MSFAPEDQEGGTAVLYIGAGLVILLVLGAFAWSLLPSERERAEESAAARSTNEEPKGRKHRPPQMFQPSGAMPRPKKTKTMSAEAPRGGAPDEVPEEAGSTTGGGIEVP